MTPEQGSPALARVAEGDLCCGCGACAAIAPKAIRMRLVGKGVLRPEQEAPVTPEAEARIGRSCPGLGLTAPRPADLTEHPLWGPYAGLYSGFATDPDLRRNASSGGVLSALLVFLLESDRVDRVLQVGADLALPFGNRNVTSVTDGDVFACAGSRYAPSAPLAALASLPDDGTRYAFVGKPCDVAALRAMTRDDPRLSERFPWVLSFFCAGVPAHSGAREVLARMGVEEAEVASFRYRGDGWPGYATATLRSGRRERMSYADSWGGVLSRHVQARCKICPDGTGSFADVVCADAWETDEQGYPVFDDREGMSLVVARNDRGDWLVQEAIAAGRVEVAPFDVAALEGMQPGQTRKRQLTLARMAALRMLGRPVPVYRGFHLWKNARRAPAALLLRNFLGTLRRAMLGRI